jgi:hypothetical protein
MIKQLLTARVLASVAAVASFGAFGAYGTYSAFTSTTQASGSEFAAGTVSITDDDAGNKLFQLTGMVPGTTETKCINVKNAGDVPFADVKLDVAATGDLAPALKVSVDRGSAATGGSALSCTNFVQSAGNIVNGLLSVLTGNSPISDASGWTANATKSYRVTVTLDPLAGALYQGKTAQLNLTWTAST